MNILSRLIIGVILLASAAANMAPQPAPAQAPVAQDPMQVVLLEPAHGAYIWPPEVTFRWQPVEGAEAYLLHYFSETEPWVTQETLVTDTQLTLSLPAGVSYQWWVTAVVPVLHGAPAAGMSPTAEPGPQPVIQEERRVFTISDIPLAPAPPASANPHAGGYNDRVRITWQASLRAERYRIERANLLTGEITPLGETNLTEFEDLTAAAGQTYRYSLRACNATGCSAPVDVYSWLGMCRVEMPVPALISPVNGAQITGSLYRLEWTAQPGIQEYEIEVTDQNSQQVVFQTVTNNAFLADVPLQGSLSWRVRALDPVTGCAAGAWSAARTYLAQAPTPFPQHTSMPAEITPVMP